MSKPRQYCVYCGATENLTKDHVPPQNLFAKPRPSNLITVPCCQRCHKPTSKDDEYFRLTLSLEEKAGEHPDARSNWESIFRSFQKSAKARFRRAFSKQLQLVDVQTPAGLYVGKKLAYNVNLKRLDRVVERVVKGLFWHEIHSRLPETHMTSVWSESGLRDLSSEERERLQKAVVEPVSANPPSLIGKGVFSYRFARAKDDPSTTAWLLEFYKSVRFVGMTAPIEAVAAARASAGGGPVAPRRNHP